MKTTIKKFKKTLLETKLDLSKMEAIKGGKSRPMKKSKLWPK
jgi:hypothetical protein